MNWFGRHWGAPVCDDSAPVAVPPRTRCYVCAQPVEATHSGLVFPFRGDGIPERNDPANLYAHLACFARTLGMRVPD